MMKPSLNEVEAAGRAVVTPHPGGPRFIALCGAPGAGKGEVQRMLAALWGVKPVDDGFPMRDFAMRHLGLSRADVYTAAGKAGASEINGVDWVNRDVLGEFGRALERLFGEDVVPWMAVRTLPSCGRYSFGSVRRQQGWFFKRLGGLVVEIDRSVAGSGRDFDLYDPAAVDVTVKNNGSLDDLRAGVIAALSPYFGLPCHNDNRTEHFDVV